MKTSRACLLLLLMQVSSAVSGQGLPKRAPQGFFGMRGKKLDDYDQYHKRKPQFFVGVKGKKLSNEIMDYYKRAPMGFIGMRGKKQSYVDAPLENTPFPSEGSLIGQIDYTLDNNDEFPLLSMLKTILQERLNESREVEKRAASYKNFYGVRGKKIQNGGLTVRGKFIGVRGKKDADGAAAFDSERERFKRMPTHFADKNPVLEYEDQNGFVN